jgi:hypothetical protein
MAMETYSDSARSIYRAGRALVDAAQFGDLVEIRMAEQRLLGAVSAYEGAGGAAGTAGFSGGPGLPAQITEEDALDAVLIDLDVGRVLLTAGATADPVEPRTSDLLADALDALDQATTPVKPPGGTAGFSGGAPQTPTAETLTVQFEYTVDGIVDRTAAVGRNVLVGITSLPASTLQPVLGGVIAAIPQVGPLVRAGVRAVQRAVDALVRLVPAALRDQLQSWAAQWWEQRVEATAEHVVRSLLAVDAATAAARTALAESVTPAKVGEAQGSLADLDGRHRRVIGIVNRIVTAITTLVGPLAAMFAAAAAWLYGAGAAGLLLALGAAIWFGRDYLDSGIIGDRVPGVRTILTGLAG